MLKVLLTVGPTAVFLDKVRVISNISSGKLGFYLALLLSKKCNLQIWASKSLYYDWPTEVYRFYTYDDLKILALNCRDRFDLVVHMAAVSDFAPQEMISGKIGSDKELTLRLTPLPKLWPAFKRISDRLVLFKLEPDLNLAVKEAGRLLAEDDKIIFVVANSLETNDGYKGRIVSRQGLSMVYDRRKDMAGAIVDEIMSFLRGEEK